MVDGFAFLDELDWNAIMKENIFVDSSRSITTGMVSIQKSYLLAKSSDTREPGLLQAVWYSGKWSKTGTPF
ncbi:hypothetical protein GCM10027286_00370 [Virgibacillus ainsalahensis]